MNCSIIISLKFQGTSEEWQLLFYVGAAVAVAGAISYLALGTQELQPWAKDDDDNEGEKSEADSRKSQDTNLK